MPGALEGKRVSGTLDLRVRWVGATMEVQEIEDSL